MNEYVGVTASHNLASRLPVQVITILTVAKDGSPGIIGDRYRAAFSGSDGYFVGRQQWRVTSGTRTYSAGTTFWTGTLFASGSYSGDMWPMQLLLEP